MATAKKASAKKAAVTTAKAGKKATKAAATSAAKAKPAAPVTKPIKTAFNKSTLVAHIADASGQEPKTVKAVFAALDATVLQSLNKKGLGEFTLPGLLKVTAVKVAAKKARKGINPFTKEPTVFKAKPATVKVKVRALKKLKDAAA